MLERRMLVRSSLATLIVAVALLLPNQGLAKEQRGVFPGRTGDVLVFDDGYDGATFVDLDRRVAVRRTLHGRAGDQPYHLSRVADSLVAGWSEIYATPLDTGVPELLGEATIFIPAVEDDRVWLVDYPGGRIGAGEATIRLVDSRGNELLERPALPGNPPIVAIPGGLAYQASTSLELWDASTSKVTGSLGTGSVFPSDVHDRTVAWCQGACSTLQLTDLDGEEHTVAPPFHLKGFVGYSGRFSPDGRWFAALAVDTTGPWTDTTRTRIVIIDARSGRVRDALPLAPGGRVQEAAWSSDSERLYLTTNSYRKKRTQLGVYSIADGNVERTVLPFGGLMSFLVLDRDEAATMLDVKRGDRADCRPPPVQASPRPRPCAFGF